MKGKIIFTFVFLLVTLIASSCESEIPPSATVTQEKPMIEPTSTFEPFVIGECHPAAELIEMNNSYNKGVGCGYTDLEYGCAMYCLWVPEGSQLKISITDTFSDLTLIVKRDLFEDLDSAAGWISDEVGRYRDESVTIENPGGRYYILACPKGGQSCSFRGNAVVFTSAALFTLNSEFEVHPSQSASNETDSPPIVISSSGLDQPGSLTVRTGPGRQYSPTKYQIPMESGAALVGRTADGNWLLVEFGSTQGWVPASEVTVSGSYSLVPIIVGTPAPTSTPEPCLKRIAESIIGDKGFKELRTELYDLVVVADSKLAEDLGPIICRMEELLEEIEGYEFAPPYSSCTQRVHAAIYNFAWHKKQYYSIKYAEYIDEADYTDDIKILCNRAKTYEEEYNRLIQELEELITE